MAEEELAVGEKEEEPWYSGIDEKFHEGISRFKDPSALAKSYLDLEKSASTKVKLPTEDASDEDLAKFYSKLGRPDKPDGYPSDLDEKNEEFMKSLKTLSHKANLSKKQFDQISKGLYEYESGLAKQLVDAQGKAQADMLDKLRTEVGGEENLKTMISSAVAAVTEIEEKHGITGLKDHFEETGLGDDPFMIKLFDFIGKNILSDSLVKGTVPGKKESKQRWEPEFHERYPGAS